MKNIKQNRAFTIVEVIVMMLILSMLSAVAYRLMAGTFAQFFKSQTKLSNLRAGTIILERLKSDIRMALIPANDSEKPVISATTLRFPMVYDGKRRMVSYSFEDSHVTREIVGVSSRVISSEKVADFKVVESGEENNPMLEITISVDRDHDLEGRFENSKANLVELKAVLFPKFYTQSLSDEQKYWNNARQRAGGTV